MKTESKIITILLSAAVLLSACGKEEKDTELKDFFLTSPSSGSLTLAQNEDFRIKFGTVPEEAAGTVQVEWSIDDPSIATVKNGRITPQAPGDAVITAKCGKFMETVNLKVKGIPVTSFSVPEKLDAYYGNPREIPLTVGPSEANAASLNWYVEDENVAFVTIEDGKAYINATSDDSGTTTLTVSAENLEPKTIDITARSRGMSVLYSYTDNSVSYDLADDKELDFNLLPFNEEFNAPYLTLLAAKEISSLEIAADNPKICTFSNKFISDFLVNWYSIVAEAGSEYGTTGVTVTAKMDGLTFTRRFSVKREPLVFPDGVCIYSMDMKRPLVSEEKVARGQVLNLMMTAGGQTSYYAKWSTSDASIATISTNDFTRKAVVNVSQSKTGKVTVTASDESGKTTRTVVLNVSREEFDEDTYLVDSSTGERCDAGGLNVREHGSSFRVRLSKSYKYLTWTTSDASTMAIEPNSNNPSEVTVSFMSPMKEAVLMAKDEAGSKTLSYTFRSDLSLRSLKAVPARDGYSDVIYYSRRGMGDDWIFMPFTDRSSTLKMELTDGKGRYVNDLNSGGWSAELVSGAQEDVFKQSGTGYYEITTSSRREKRIAIRDQFGNRKTVVVHPTFDFRNKDFAIVEQLKDKSQEIEYNNGVSRPVSPVRSLARKGSVSEDYTLYGVGPWHIYDFTLALSIRKVQNCDWGDWSQVARCNGQVETMVQLFRYLNDAPETFTYTYQANGKIQVMNIYDSHSHHNRHLFEFWFEPLTNYNAKDMVNSSKEYVYGGCIFYLKME